MAECPFISTNPDLSESVEEFFNKNCSELVDNFVALEKISKTIVPLDGQIHNLVDELSPYTRVEFDNNVLSLTEQTYEFKFEYFDEDVNRSWNLATNKHTFLSDRPQDFPNPVDIATKVEILIQQLENEDYGGTPGSVEFAEDIAKLKKIKGVLQSLNAPVTNMRRLLARTAELYEKHKKVSESATNLAATRRDLNPLENLLSMGDPDAAAAAARRAEAAIAESRSPGASFVAVDKALYREQCFLLSQIPTLLKLKKEMPPRLPYNEADKINKNAPVAVFDEPFGFMNRMTQAPHSYRLFNLTTAQISSLVPTLKLYKVLTEPSTGKDLGYVEIKFDSNPAVKSYIGDQSAIDLFKSKNKRGLGVGLKDFNFTFHGSDPFAAKKAIQAKVSIFATSFGDLIQERSGEVYPTTAKIGLNVDKNYKFADLALKTGKTPEDLRKNLSSVQKDNLDKLNFRLKVVLGWAIPNKYLSSFTAEDRNAVNDSFINLSLTPTTHEFSFDEMGGVTFNINYLAYIEDYFNNSMFNIFSSPGVEANRIGRRLMYDYLENNNCESTDITKIREVDAQSIQLEKIQSFRKIISDFTIENRIFYYNLSYTQISQFLKTGKVPPGMNLNPKLDGKANTKEIDKMFSTISSNLEDNSSIENLEKVIDSIKVSLYSTSSESNKITFVFISDLLDIIMRNIDITLNKLCDEAGDENKKIFNYASQIGENFLPELKSKLDQFSTDIAKNKVLAKEIQKLRKAKEQFRKMRIVLGPMEIKDSFNPNKSYPCTIGDVPVSLNYLIDFLTEKKLSKDETTYPISNFIKDLVNDLIRNFLNTDSCFSFNKKQRIALNSATVSCYTREENKSGNDDITYFIKENPTTIGRGNIFQGFYLKDLVKNTEPSERKLPPVLLVSGPSRLPLQLLQASREFNYQIFYAGRAYPAEKMKGDEQQDLKNGIFHYLLGKDRGLVKNISLERTDMTGLKELRFEQEGFDGLTQLREVYNANIDSMLNVQTFPGTYIFIDPRGFSPEAGIDYTQFGIGGYYMITRSEHSIGPGKADTKIVAKWVAHASKEIDNQQEKIVSEEETVPRKCLAQNREKSFFDLWSESVVVKEETIAEISANPGAYALRKIKEATNTSDN